jgi:two-component system response regulator YesN
MIDWRVRATVSLLNERWAAKGLRLSSVSQRFGVSPRYLGKIFKANTGMSFHQYLRWVRMDVACKFLSDSSRSVEEVARRVGYDDVSNFLRAFRSALGITPYQYRQASASLPHDAGRREHPAAR